MSGKLLVAYAHSQEIDEQLAAMQNELADWRQKTEILAQQPFRPVEKEYLENVQSDIMLALQGHHLELPEFKSVSRNDTSQIFDLSFLGTYENTLEYLNYFGSGNADNVLINIVDLKMTPEKGAIKTTVRYIVFTK